MELPQYTEFLKWSTNNNIIFHPHISLHSFPHMGYGFKANEDIQSGETVIKVPLNCQLSFDNSDFKKEVSFDHAKLNNTELLALSLLYEMTKETSFYAPYISILPDSVDSILFWSEEEQLQLENTNLEDMNHGEIAKDFNKKIAPLVKNWHKNAPTSSTSSTSKKKSANIPKTKECTLDMYKKVLGIVLSRAFQMEEGVPYLCPAIDMINAVTESNNIEVGTIKDKGTSLYLIAKACKDIPAGNQLLFTYGAFSNSELLRKYGYVEENNKFNEVHVDMDLVCDVCEEMLGKLPEDRKAFIDTDTVILGTDFSNTAFLEDIKRVAELHAVESEDFELLQELAVSDGKETAWKTYHEQSGGMPDKQVRGIALLILGRKVIGYPTSLEEDQVWLQKNDGYSRKKFAVQLRLIERQLLTEWMQIIKGETQPASTTKTKAKVKKAKNKKRKIA